jgi:3-dehydroquinate dehydratase/shikimate dehydrogenase
MICVSIGRGRHKHVIAEHKHLVEQGAKLVELRLDYINGTVNLKRLLVDRPCPVVITCRRERDGGKWAGSESDRQMLLRAAIVDGVEYIDLEEDIAKSIPRFGKTKRIVSYHDFSAMPSDLEALHARMAGMDADIVKIAAMGHSTRDNLRCLNLMRCSDIPTVAICMGEIGTPSRILAARFGAPFSYATFHHERSLAPGQLSYQQMVGIYHYDEINGDTSVYGVIADPIGHSLSPVIHNACFRALGINSVYVPFRVPREDLDTFLDGARELGVKGLSVTIPHKEAVIRKLSKIDGAARAIGAVNTIVFGDGESHGYNTDYRAAMDCLDAASGVDASEKPLSGRKALILGAGGVAKALAFGLKRRGATVFIANRSPERAAELAERMECSDVPWEDRHKVEPHILINGTPIGMHPNVDESPYDKRMLVSSMVVFDTVYNPESTLLIKDARAVGAKVVTGVEMFLRQAAYQFKLFSGVDAPMQLMRDTLKRATGAAKY